MYTLAFLLVVLFDVIAAVLNSLSLPRSSFTGASSSRAQAFATSQCSQPNIPRAVPPGQLPA